MSTPQPGPPSSPNPAPTPRSRLHQQSQHPGSLRSGGPPREALLVTALVAVAIIGVLAVALVFSRDGGADDPNTPATQGQTGGAASTATTASLQDPSTTTGSGTAPTVDAAGSEGGDAADPSASTERELPPLATKTPEQAAQGEQDSGTGGAGAGGETPQAPPGDVPQEGAEATEADGFIADDAPISVWDTAHPALANLAPALLAAIQQAATDAEAEGIVMVVTSGWRSAAYQQRLLDEAIINFGSEEEARKWVKTPDTSTHVSGTAIDIGYTDADYWLIERGAAYGLCQTYANEIWHFELTIEPGGVCPPPVEDASTP